jgi:hypothetical protein
VSAGFLASPYCGDVELNRALERHASGDACVIPVILRPADWTTTALGHLQALPANAKPVTNWSNRDEAFLSIALGIRKVAQTLAERSAPAEAPISPSPASAPAKVSLAHEPAAEMEFPEGPVPHGSPYYILPADEPRCRAELDKPGALIRIKGSEGFGKSSLTSRLLIYANGQGYRTVALNLDGTDLKFFEDTDRFMQWFCAALGKGLGLRLRTEEYWDDIFGANDNSSDFVETYLLKPDVTPLVLAIGNFDRIFEHVAIETDFCGLLRSWHERARSDPLWERFRLVLAHSYESYLQKDINQSPFNVGLPVELDELRPEDVDRLVALHGLNLSESDVGQVLELVGGHPYLVRKALYELSNGLPFASFLREAPTEAGVFGSHLRGILKAVEDHPELADALRQVVNSTELVMLPSEVAFKLESLGVLVPEGNQVRLRYKLYARYFADRLAH